MRDHSYRILNNICDFFQEYEKEDELFDYRLYQYPGINFFNFSLFGYTYALSLLKNNETDEYSLLMKKLVEIGEHITIFENKITDKENFSSSDYLSDFFKVRKFNFLLDKPTLHFNKYFNEHSRTNNYFSSYFLNSLKDFLYSNLDYYLLESSFKNKKINIYDSVSNKEFFRGFYFYIFNVNNNLILYNESIGFELIDEKNIYNRIDELHLKHLDTKKEKIYSDIDSYIKIRK